MKNNINMFEISIIIPIYNAEKYLRECIDSIINQTSNLINTIEIVLINDGSIDASGNICEEYVKKYPNNIKYIVQTNSGVSAARNKGIEVATGKIIGFSDADDKFSDDFAEAIIDFFNCEEFDCDVAVIPVKNFGAKETKYYLNGKFIEGTRVIDVNECKWYDVCTRVSQAFFRREAISDCEFDCSVSLFEDTKFVNDVIAKRMKVGVVTGCCYYYRRYPQEADENTSLTVGAENNKNMYLNTPKSVSLYLLEKNTVDGKTPEYFQFVALCEMRWRLFYKRSRISDILSDAERKEYLELNNRILSYITEQTIIAFDNIALWQKIYLLNMKQNDIDCSNKYQISETGDIQWGSFHIGNINGVGIIVTDILAKDNYLHLKWYLKTYINGDCKVGLRANDTKYYAVVFKEQVELTIFSLDYEYEKYDTFECSIPIKEETVIEFFVEIGNNTFSLRKLSYKVPDNKRNYIVSDNMIIWESRKYIRIRNNNILNQIKLHYRIIKNRIKKYSKKERK